MARTNDYGVYALVVALLLWIGNFSEIGVFSAASRLLAHFDDETARARCNRRLFDGGDRTVPPVRPPGRWSRPRCRLDLRCKREPRAPVRGPGGGGLALETAVQYLCQGARRSALLATRNLIGRPLTLVLVIGAHLIGSLTVAFACWAFAFGSTVSACAVFVRLRPTRRRLGEGWAAIRDEMRRANDGAMYVGRLVGSSMFNIDRMLVAYFLTSAAVGYYALAFSLVAPITLGVQSIAIAGYARLARSPEVPRNLLCASFGWLARQWGPWLCADHRLRRAFPARVPADAWESCYRPSSPPLSLASSRSSTSFSRRMVAAGRSAASRLSSRLRISASISLLIPLAGIKGGAYASLATVMVPLVGVLIAYRRYSSTNERSEPAATLPARATVARAPGRLDTGTS